MKLFVAVALALAARCSAGVLLDSVDVSTQFPSMGTILDDGGVKTIDGSIEYPAGSFPIYNPSMSIQITSTQLILSLNGTSTFFTSASFNGFEVSFLTGTITGAVADGSSNFNPVITISGNNLFLNYQGETVTSGQLSIIDLTGTSSSVPEPATVGILGSGLAALAFFRRYIRS